MKAVSAIPLSDIARLEIVAISCKMGLEQVPAMTETDYILR